MASSLCRRLLHQHLTQVLSFRTPSPPSLFTLTKTRHLSSSVHQPTDSDSDSETVAEHEHEIGTESDSTSNTTPSRRPFVSSILEDGVDVGIYKAILVGQVGQMPIQKKLKNGRTITLMSIGTGGVRNNRRPMDNEDPKEYANRCSVQWHRVTIYPEKLGNLAMKNAAPGSILYVEGNLESKIFTDPVTGIVRRLREVALRQNGRLVFLGKGSESFQADIRKVGYY